MARTVAGLRAGTRLTDHISQGALTTRFPLATVAQVLVETARASQRERDLPAHVMVCYAIALALYADVSTRRRSSSPRSSFATRMLGDRAVSSTDPRPIAIEFPILTASSLLPARSNHRPSARRSVAASVQATIRRRARLTASRPASGVRRVHRPTRSPWYRTCSPRRLRGASRRTVVRPVVCTRITASKLRTDFKHLTARRSRLAPQRALKGRRDCECR